MYKLLGGQVRLSDWPDCGDMLRQLRDGQVLDWRSKRMH
jgi:hypothetical protein